MTDIQMTRSKVFASGLLVGVALAVAAPFAYVPTLRANQFPDVQQLAEIVNRHDQTLNALSETLARVGINVQTGTSTLLDGNQVAEALNRHERTLNIMSEAFARMGLNMQTEVSAVPDVIQLSRKVECLNIGGTFDAGGTCSK